LTKTTIYIDGYNLYYSRLKGTPFKWLDIATLFRDTILPQQDPSAQVVSIKYFTAPVKASYARHGQNSEHAQTQYLRAVQELLGHANITTTQVHTRLDFQHLAKAYDEEHLQAQRK
jgi:integrase